MDGYFLPHEGTNNIAWAMRLLSAYGDFWQRSVQSLPTLWDKLVYVAGLCGAGGIYQHWGLERTFRTEAAQKAMASAQSELFIQVLRTPISQVSS